MKRSEKVARSSEAARSVGLSTWDSEGGFLPGESGTALSSVTPSLRPDPGPYAQVIVDSEQTTDQTFRVTEAPDGRIGVVVFINGNPGIVLWLDGENRPAAARLALHLETQVDRVSCLPGSSDVRGPTAA